MKRSARSSGRLVVTGSVKKRRRLSTRPRRSLLADNRTILGLRDKRGADTAGAPQWSGSEAVAGFQRTGLGRATGDVRKCSATATITTATNAKPSGAADRRQVEETGRASVEHLRGAGLIAGRRS